MHARVLALLVAGLLTMGAVSAPPAGYIPPTRTAAQAELAALTRAAEAGDATAVARRASTDGAIADVAPDPAGTGRWWRALPGTARTLLALAAPGVVGNLEGVPYDVRDRANRTVLARALQAEWAPGAATGKGEALLTADRVRTLQQVVAALRRTPGGPRRFLVALDPRDETRAAVAVGDPQTAGYVDFLVPGMYFTVRDQLVDWTDTAAQVQGAESAWLARFHDRRTAAVVSWIGYRTPDLLTVFGLGPARAGAVRLADAVNGLRGARADRPFVGVLAHSYGATSALLALQAHAFRADALAMVGAPGSPAASTRALAVPAHATYVGRAEFDGVATSGFFGSDPAAPSYGAAVLGAQGGVDPISKAVLRPAVGHNGYFAPGTESLRNIALIGIGHGADVTDGRTAGRVLALAR